MFVDSMMPVAAGKLENESCFGGDENYSFRAKERLRKPTGVGKHDSRQLMLISNASTCQGARMTVS